MKKRVGTVDICGLPFAVYLADEAGCPRLLDCYGATHVDKQEICISHAMPTALRRLYLDHEVLHGVWAHTGTDDLLRAAPVTAVEEPFVRAWAYVLRRALDSAKKVKL
jgi:hypothetical protein